MLMGSIHNVFPQAGGSWWSVVAFWSNSPPASRFAFSNRCHAVLFFKVVVVVVVMGSSQSSRKPSQAIYLIQSEAKPSRFWSRRGFAAPGISTGSPYKNRNQTMRPLVKTIYRCETAMVREHPWRNPRESVARLNAFIQTRSIRNPSNKTRSFFSA